MLMPVALVLMGPTTWFGGLPDEIWLIFVGLAVMGFSAAMMYVLVIPEMFNALQEEF